MEKYSIKEDKNNFKEFPWSMLRGPFDMLSKDTEKNILSLENEDNFPNGESSYWTEYEEKKENIHHSVSNHWNWEHVFSC